MIIVMKSCRIVEEIIVIVFSGNNFLHLGGDFEGTLIFIIAVCFDRFNERPVQITVVQKYQSS